jgi:N-acetylglucosamine-6-phosphate deacetylase
MGTLLLCGALSRAGRRAPGWVDIDGESIVACGEGEPPRDPDERCEGVIAPGLCDLQVNGAGGFDVSAGDAAVLEAIDAVQLAHGVTATLPTLVSPDPGTAERALAAIAERRSDRSSPVVGAHVEGPFLNPRRRGMHPAGRLRSPADGLPSWLDSPAIRLVTLAPELPGALALIERLTARGVRVSLGHSEADEATVTAAIDAGATAVTHVFNAMAPLHHRAPGLAGAALVEERLALGVIADGLHVAPAVLELTRRAAGSRTVLVSDSGPGAAAPPGRYELAGVTIEADAAGAARTAQGELAGSTVTLDVAMVRWATLTGATLDEAIAAASERPAALIGLPQPLRPGAPADLVVLSQDGAVRRVMHAGRWVRG